MGEARIKVECYDGNKRKEEGAMIDVDFIDNSRDNHPLDESCGLLGGIHHSSSINTKADSHVCGRLVTKNVINIFNHKMGIEASIKTTKRVNWGRFVEVKYESKIMQERNFKFVPKFILKGGGHPFAVKDNHDTTFGQQIEPIFMLVTISSIRETQVTKLEFKVWDLEIT
ncbi:hypothetical protein Tco_1106256 [Tanacetum coccineum]